MATGGKDLDQATAQPTTTRHPQNAKGNFPTGYECEFVEPPPHVLPTECSVCLHIPREPHLVSCCGHHFCKSCIEHTWSENKPCPLCNQPDFTATLDKSVQRHLNDLKVYCIHKEQGCEWVGELRHLDRHLNANPMSGEELTGCAFVEVNCIHGCGWRFQRRSLTEHHNNCPSRPFSCEYCSHSSTYQDVVDNHWPECPKYPLQCPNSCEDSLIERQHFEEHQTTCPIRPFSCEYCGHLSTYRDVVTNHWPECPKCPLQCPNSCEDSPIERQNLEDHLNKECPLQKVNCEFHYAGCTAQVQRRDMAAHMRDNLPKHISQLSSTTRILVADNRDEIEQKFEQETTILKEQVEQRQQEIEGVVKQEQAEVKEDLERKLQDASDNTQTSLQHTLNSNNARLNQNGMIVAATIIFLVAVLVGVLNIMQHQQIQQLRQNHTKATEQIQQLRQNHIEATELIQQLRQNGTELIQQLQQNHTKQIQQLRQNHTKATEQIQQLRQNHTKQIQQLRQKQTEANILIQHMRQGHNDTTEKLSNVLKDLQYQLHHAPALVSPSMCTADGPGLHSPTVNVTTEITVSVVNILGLAYSGDRVNVTAELQSDSSITQADISYVDTSKYRVTFTPTVRGQSRLYVKINNNNIKGSPFNLSVSPEHPKIGELKAPRRIAINSHGEIFVTQWVGHKVAVFGTNQENRTIGSRGERTDGKFWFPAGIDIDADDNVYVASEYKLQKFNRNGEHIKSVGSNKEIRGVRVHKEKVYVCDRDNKQILVYDLELTFIRQFGNRGTGEGKFIRPIDIDFDAKGNAYVVDFGNNRVQVLKGDGQFLREFGREELNDPHGIHIAGDYVYVSLSNKVGVFRTSGDFVTTIGENFGEVFGITTDSNGSLYVCEYSLDRCIIL